MEKNHVMLICHKLDIIGEIVRRNKIDFKKIGTTVWNFNTVIMRFILFLFLLNCAKLLFDVFFFSLIRLLIENNPKYQNLSPIVEAGMGKNHYFFFKEDKLKANLTLLRRMPHFILLGNTLTIFNHYRITST